MYCECWFKTSYFATRINWRVWLHVLLLLLVLPWKVGWSYFLPKCSINRELMVPELKKCWKLFILQPTKTLFLGMCRPWFQVASGWVGTLITYLHHTYTITEWAMFLDGLNCISGTPALTSRGFVEEDFAKVAYFFDAAVKLAVKIKSETQGSCQYFLS